MAVDAILPRHCIMPGQIHASPVFDNASRALQRISLDNDATTAIAAGDAQAMEQVLEMAVRLNNQVVGRRVQVAALHGLTCTAFCTLQLRVHDSLYAMYISLLCKLTSWFH